MSHLLRDFRHSLRLLRRAPAFSVVAILVLAVGIGANTAVFSLVNALALQPRPGRIDRLVGIYSRDRVKPDSFRDFSYPEYVDLRERSGVFESLMAHTFAIVGIREGDARRSSFAAVVSANYFATLGVPLAAGRPFSEAEERPGAAQPVAIASWSMWRRANFDPAFLGSVVRVNGTDMTIVGIAPRGFAGTMTILSPEVWFPLGMYDVVVNDMLKKRSTGLGDRANHVLNLAGALKAGVGTTAAEGALETFSKGLAAEYPATDRDRSFVLAGLPRMGVSSKPERDTAFAVISLALTLMAGLVLIVACLNLANLLLARGGARRREIAIRQALGSGRGRIVRQLVIEGLVLSLAGAAVGSVVAWWTTRALSASFTAVLPFGISVIVEPNFRVLAAAIAFAAFSTLFFAVGPAWSLSRPAVVADLKGEISSVGRRFGAGAILVTTQLAVSLALVAVGGLFVRAAINAGHTEPGFALAHQVIVSLDPSLAKYDRARTLETYRSALERVRSVAGVERASMASTVPFGEFREGRNVRVPGATEGLNADFVVVGAGYFRTLGISVLRGREFEPAEEDQALASRRAVIDSLLSRRLFGGADAIGRQMTIQEGDDGPSMTYTIVGVVAPVVQELFDLEPEPHVYVPYGAEFRAAMTLHVRTTPSANDVSVLATIRSELQRMDPSLPILSARTMEIQRDASVPAWAVRAAAGLFSAFGGLALLLATLGVYGLRAYDVSRRTREIGIRVALGATSGDVERLVIAEGARTAAIGTAIGLLLAAGIGRLLRSLLFHVSPLDPTVVATSAVLLATAAMLACYLPARRAARIAPLDALRSE